jgi:tetratricopeptide (TPR) repeat protein
MYASPHRRKAAASAPVTAVPSKSPSTPSTKPTRPRRAIVKASIEQHAKSAEYRTTGNEHFKLGMYGDAVEAYNLSLDALPEYHLGRIAVLNNRANARLKIGQERKAAEDASAVLALLASPADLANMKREDWEAVLHDFDKHPAGLDGEKFEAHDALGKALSRRAKGYEGCEKWRLAMLDWQLLTELGDAAVLKSAGGMKLVSEGLSRCRKVVDGPSAPTTKSAVKSKPPMRKPTIPVASSPVISDVVDKLRQTNEKAEEDEVERIAVKDSVDSKITEWKGGKETNLRALIASLDSVLWEELGWKKVGMHELITDSQLKVRYVRAISKVHPDKVSIVAARQLAGCD